MALSPADFDPRVVAEYGITAETLDRVVRYLRLLQGPDAPALADIAIGGYYGTAALLHEVIELNILLKREPGLLEMDEESALNFWHANTDAHITALVAEYTYLQRRIRQVLGEKVSVGALLWVNADEHDFAMLATSDWPGPLRIPDAAEVDRARRLLGCLKERTL